MILFKIFLIYFSVASVLTFITYVVDKVKAVNGAWRVPEKVLLGLSLLGGAVGGYLAMQIARHKTKHWYFHVLNFVGIVWQVGLLVYLALNPAII
ncbi:MAG: DUF1294 domain-containing protein [Clostridiales bacterium]|jgi:uncharacterized membrane protein YsdA (DUF1294 family)|nr:DUF1294 domain-containing protein [Clostridiales bacterium]